MDFPADGTAIGLLGAAAIVVLRSIGPDLMGLIRRARNGGRPVRNGADLRVDRIVEGLTSMESMLERHDCSVCEILRNAGERDGKQLEVLNGIRADLQRVLGRGDPR